MAPQGSDRGFDASVSLSAAEVSRWNNLLSAGLHSLGGIRLLEKLVHSQELVSSSNYFRFRLQRATESRIVVLCYHRVGTHGLPLYSYLPAKRFEAQMRYLRERYRIISLGQALEELDNPENSSPAVAVTFDDGYRDVYSNAFPVLREYGIPATVFLTVNSIETGEVPWYDRVFLAFQLLETNSVVLEGGDTIHYSLTTAAARFLAALDYVRRLRRLPDSERRKCCAALKRLAFLPANHLQNRMLTWEHINVMQESGISFGSHTFSHPVVSRLDPGQVEYEVGGSKRFLEAKLGRPVLDFAFPFGQPDDCGTAACAVLHSCGYRLALTTTWGVNRPATDRFALHRVQIGEEFSLSRFAFELNQLFLRPGGGSPPRNGDFPSMETAEQIPALSAGREK